MDMTRLEFAVKNAGLIDQALGKPPFQIESWKGCYQKLSMKDQGRLMKSIVNEMTPDEFIEAMTDEYSYHAQGFSEDDLGNDLYSALINVFLDSRSGQIEEAWENLKNNNELGLLERFRDIKEVQHETDMA